MQFGRTKLVEATGAAGTCRRFERRSRRVGFTLIEAALAIIIVGVGVVAAMELFAACSQQNQLAGRVTVGAMLARNVEEAVAQLPFDDPIFGSATFGPETGEELRTYDDTDDFHNFSSLPLAGPIDVLRQPIPELSQYEQRVTVTRVNAGNLTLATPAGTAVRVDVGVLWRRTPAASPQTVFVASWYRVR